MMDGIVVRESGYFAESQVILGSETLSNLEQRLRCEVSGCGGPSSRHEMSDRGKIVRTPSHHPSGPRGS